MIGILLLWVSKKRDVIEDVGVIVGLVAVQFLYAGNSILLSYILKFGVHPSSLIIFSSFATFLILSPFSILFERRLWPIRFSRKLLLQVLLISFGGVTVFQSLFMKGVSLTSPEMATAMPNLAPGLIFCIAWALRLEKVKLGCIYSRAKIAGTLLCVLGAVAMSVMKSVVQQNTAKDQSEVSLVFDRQTIVGCIYLIAAVFDLSFQVILQAITLRDFPAPISLCAVTSLIGGLMTAVAQMFEDDRQRQQPEYWPLLTIQEMVVYAILTGSVSGMCVSLNAWAMKKRGPVIVAIFNPLGTVISAIFSVITLGESIGAGSLGGMCLMFTGLYLVLWAKRKEDFSITNDKSLEIEPDVEKPLLA
ncbi:wat1-related protein at5g47470 [Phtheirospermum japonicum]|uniref:WAT1-related protein n=1 Tax=Phtheirospermum japonicum TaxID=374723 RepID=A0A830BBL7_9LAMI|nr:wat1-related protein at5g47470 [Phtheirospermum japonicum]